MAVTIRPAVEADAAQITTLVRAARINPRNLHWQRFMVAEDQGRIVGVGQVKRYPDGCRELASGVVLSEYQQQGISTRLIHALLARESGPLYMLLDARYVRHYEQFGFRPVPVSELPASLAKEYRLGRIITTIESLLRWRRIRIVPLRREA